MDRTVPKAERRAWLTEAEVDDVLFVLDDEDLLRHLEADREGRLLALWSALAYWRQSDGAQFRDAR